MNIQSLIKRVLLKIQIKTKKKLENQKTNLKLIILKEKENSRKLYHKRILNLKIFPRI